MECNRHNLLSFWTVFCPFTPIWTQKIKILKKWTPEEINILQMCTINDSHMMYGSWDMKCQGQNFLSFWSVFCPFTYLTTQKIKILKKIKKKKPGEFIILHICTVNDGHMMYGSWDMKHDRQNFLSFWTVYPPLFCPFTPPNSPEI